MGRWIRRSVCGGVFRRLCFVGVRSNYDREEGGRRTVLLLDVHAALFVLV
jgi:hypothetical protein